MLSNLHPECHPKCKSGAGGELREGRQDTSTLLALLGDRHANHGGLKNFPKDYCPVWARTEWGSYVDVTLAEARL